MIIFDRTPTTYQEGWVIIKQLLEKWHQLTLDWNEADHRLIVADLEEKSGLPLPPSLRHWIYLNETMIKSGQWLLRDFHDIKYRSDIGAITLMIQGEEDYYWAIQREHLTLSDPPVDGYTIDYQGRVQWDKRISPTLTTFLITYLLDYHMMFEGTGGYNATLPDKEALIDLFTAEFPHSIIIGGYHIFESEHVLAFIQDAFSDRTKADLSVHYSGSPDHLPNCVRNNFRHQGSYYGPAMKTERV
jgi:hypothetical protein